MGPSNGQGMSTFERIRDGMRARGEMPSDTRGIYDYGPGERAVKTHTKSRKPTPTRTPKTKAETREERLRQKLKDQWRQKQANAWKGTDPTDNIKRSDGTPW